jgi:hypothetical protein
MKLTKRQLDVLMQLAEDSNFAHYMPYMGRMNENAYYFLHSNMQKVTQQIRVLRKAGLVDVIGRDPFGDNHRAVINSKGMAVVKEALERKPWVEGCRWTEFCACFFESMLFRR